MSQASWNALKLTSDFLTKLGMHSPDPRHEARDGLKILGWIVSGLRTTATTVEAFGDHCARVAWTGVLHVMDRWAQPDRKEVKAASMELQEECAGNLEAYVAVQNSMDDLGKTFGHEFWRPAGRELSCIVATEAARQVAGAAATFGALGAGATSIPGAPGAGAASTSGAPSRGAAPEVTEEPRAANKAAHRSPQTEV